MRSSNKHLKRTFVSEFAHFRQPPSPVASFSAVVTLLQARNHEQVSDVRCFSCCNGCWIGVMVVEVAVCTRFSWDCRCGKTVYHAERVVALNKDFHKLCLKCSVCGKKLGTDDFCALFAAHRRPFF
jgi:hypothetical protein